MKQLLQRLDSGVLELVDVPTPVPTGVQILVETRASLISAGTERAIVEFGRSGMLAKAKSQPDRVRQVLEKARTDGIASTLGAVRAKLQDPLPLGYCSAGIVVGVGTRARGFAVGDRVVTNAPHGEYARVPHSLAARIPDGIDFERAAFTPLAAIALQGIRLVQPTLGETVVVYGLGLVGLLSVQLLRANGCRVIGIDRDPSRLALAADAGAITLNGSDQDVVAAVLAATNGAGADAVVLALASSSDEPAHLAANMSRSRGRLVLVGVAGLKLRRDDFFKKELTFQVSCSYGPGRYDPVYEEQGIDYPLGFVRWTEQRNFEAVLQLMAEGKLDPTSLITHRFPFERAPEAYDLVVGSEPSLGVVLEYPSRGARIETGARTIQVAGGSGRATRAAASSNVVAAVIGAGAFAQRTVLPGLGKAGFEVDVVVSSGGTSAAVAARRFGIASATTDIDAVLADDRIGTVFVLTRHDSHARLALRALEAGKHVFVEKPLALAHDDLDELEQVAASSPGYLTVGFNRRFAPLAVELARELSTRAQPASLVVTVNSGAVPPEHWTQDPSIGGGRVAGEACHFIDLARALIGSPIIGGNALSARGRDGRVLDDVTHLTLRFDDGSTAVIHYLASGSRAFPKERIEAFFDGRTIAIDNWRALRWYPRRSRLRRARQKQDKGHAAELAAWFTAVTRGDGPPIPYEELFEVSRETLRLAAAASGRGSLPHLSRTPECP